MMISYNREPRVSMLTFKRTYEDTFANYEKEFLENDEINSTDDETENDEIETDDDRRTGNDEDAVESTMGIELQTTNHWYVHHFPTFKVYADTLRKRPE
jgi:hypothetical protein